MMGKWKVNRKKKFDVFFFFFLDIGFGKNAKNEGKKKNKNDKNFHRFVVSLHT
jgi:hypothetical protein